MTAMPKTRGDIDRPGRAAERHEPRAGAYVALIVRGGAALALGVTLLAAGANLSRLTTFVAIYWIFAALMTVRFVISRADLAHRP